MKLRLTLVYGLLLLCVFSFAVPAQAQTNVFIYTTPGTHTFTVPAGVTRIEVFLVGAGGGGGGGGSISGAAQACPPPQGGGGGGGGGETTNVVLDVVPNRTYTITVASRGGGGLPNRPGFSASGTSLYYDNANAPLVFAAGGGGGGAGCGGTENGGLGGTGGGGLSGLRGTAGDGGNGGTGGGVSIPNSANAGTGGAGGLPSQDGGFGQVGYARITVIGPNTAPVAVDDTASTTPGTPVNIDVLANDTDADGDPLEFASVAQPVNGETSPSGGTVNYTPDVGFTGIDTFSYTIYDGNDGFDSATVTVTVAPVASNTPPVAVDDTASTTPGTLVNIAVLANDTDADGDSLALSGVNNPINGTAALNGNTIDYTPDDGFTGTESFSYVLGDGHGGYDNGNITVTVAPVGGSGPLVRATIPPGTIRIGDIITITVALENPSLAAGGGINALETDCSITPMGVVSGQSVTPLADIFTPDPAIINRGFTGNTLLYAVSQSASNPAVTTTGNVYRMRLSAVSVGTVVLNCVATAIDATGMQITLNFVSAAMNVENIAPGTGNVIGAVLLSHKAPGGSTVMVLNAMGAVIATTTTAPVDGSYVLTGVPIGTYTIRAESPGYLYAEGSLTVIDQQIVNKSTTLLAGDLITSPPVVIDELDVVQLAISYGLTVPPGPLYADLNGDQVVGLADLRALAENLRRTGPIVWITP